MRSESIIILMIIELGKEEDISNENEILTEFSPVLIFHKISHADKSFITDHKDQIQKLSTNDLFVKQYVYNNLLS